MKKYYAMETAGRETNLYIYGDITSWEWTESDVSSYTLSKTLEELDADIINVYINSYGGEVAEGLAIYNALKRHKAKVKTVCDGFACSIASVIFMAGDDRVMNNASLLMVHNAWTRAEGNAQGLRKTADDLDKITQASVNVYLEQVTIGEEELKAMLDAETWVTPMEALEKGFATEITGAPLNFAAPSQSARREVYAKLTASRPVAPKNPEKLQEKENIPLKLIAALLKTKGE